MAGVQMIFNISGDSTPLVRAIQAAMDGGKKVADKGGNEMGSEFGKSFGAQAKSAVLRFLGAGAIISAITKEIQQATKIEADAAKEGLGVEQMQELQRAAELTGMTVAELREAAPQVAEAFTRLMESVRESGGILDKDTVQTLADAGADLKDATATLAPAVALATRAVLLAFSLTRANVEKQVGVAAFLAGNAAPFTESGSILRQTGYEMANETSPLGVQRNRNSGRQAAEGFRAAVQASKEATIARNNGIVNALNDSVGWGKQGNVDMLSMVPGIGPVIQELQKMNDKVGTMVQQINEKL